MSEPKSELSPNQPPGYEPPEVWRWEAGNGGQFANINRPVSGATHEKTLPVGQHPIQLYSLGTPNGQKVTILLEELLEAGFSGAEYDAWLIDIGEGDQFSSGFVELNPNSKIPAMADHSPDVVASGGPLRLFESGSMLVYLAEKFGAFMPTDLRGRAEVMNWLMWQMGSAPFVGGGFGHFYTYAPFKIQYAIDRYAMESKRQLHVLDTQFAKTEFIAGADYSIADMAILAWYGALMTSAYDAQTFLSVQEYPHVKRWVDACFARPAVLRGRIVNQTGDGKLAERHSANDFVGLI